MPNEEVTDHQCQWYLPLIRFCAGRPTPAAEHLDALRNYGVVPILWTERAAARDLILAA